MTAEIAVLNKFGVAIASDSAITVESYHDNKLKTKVHNSANKLFTLSKHAPVGVMFYNTVTLGGVPWETVVKAYRNHLSDRRFAKLSEYADDFFSYLVSNKHLFPDGTVRQIFFHNVYRFLGTLINGANTRAEFIKVLNARIKYLEAYEDIDGFGEAGAVLICQQFVVEIDAAVTALLRPTYVRGNKRKIAALVNLMLRKRTPLDGYSGIVITGFGEDEYLPQLEEFSVDLHLGDRIRKWKKSNYVISHSSKSEIIPFADTEVIDTLMNGLSPGFEQQANQSAINLLFEIPNKILGGISELDATAKKKYLDAARKALPQQFREYLKQMHDYRTEKYTDPIKISISSLPVSELGAVAEALLNTSQILKKVNPDLETVGGPVDVAVISKGDGFVWIKRKHYFDPVLNHSFAHRYLK